MVWSEDGAYLALLSAKGVAVIDADLEEQVWACLCSFARHACSQDSVASHCSSLQCIPDAPLHLGFVVSLAFTEGWAVTQVAVIDAPNPSAAAFSPGNTYLTVFQRLQPGAGNAEKNLKVHLPQILSANV